MGGGASGIWGAETGHATQHHTTHRTSFSPREKDCAPSDVSGATADEPEYAGYCEACSNLGPVASRLLTPPGPTWAKGRSSDWRQHGGDGVDVAAQTAAAFGSGLCRQKMHRKGATQWDSVTSVSSLTHG